MKSTDVGMILMYLLLIYLWRLVNQPLPSRRLDGRIKQSTDTQ